jgi:RNA recognition motif-containing protein
MTDDSSRREVFIKNIPYEINDDDLSEWCSTFGPITKCIIKRDKFGNSRGFAFVTYATIEGHNNICKNNFLNILSKIIFMIISRKFLDFIFLYI